MHRGKEFPIEINRQHYVQLMVENLPTLRARLGLNQAELANILGVTRQTLSAVESYFQKAAELGVNCVQVPISWKMVSATEPL